MRINEFITEAPINTVNVQKDWRKRELGNAPPTDFKPLGKVGKLTVGVLNENNYGIDIGVLWKDGTLCAKMELAKYMVSSKAFWAVNAAFADDRLRGKGMIPKIYAFLVNNGYDLRADSDQSPGGQAIWAKLSMDPTVTVYAAKYDYKKDTWEYTAVEGIKQLQGQFYLYRDEMDEELKYIENEMESLRAIREKVNDTYIEVSKKVKHEDKPSEKMTALMKQHDAISDKISELEIEYSDLRWDQNQEEMHDMFLLAVPEALSIPAPKSDTVTESQHDRWAQLDREEELKALKLVKQNGMNIMYVHLPSEAVQLAAVKQNPFAIYEIDEMKSKTVILTAILGMIKDNNLRNAKSLTRDLKKQYPDWPEWATIVSSIKAMQR